MKCEAFNHRTCKGCRNRAKYEATTPGRMEDGRVTVCVIVVCGVHARSYNNPRPLREGR